MEYIDGMHAPVSAGRPNDVCHGVQRLQSRLISMQGMVFLLMGQDALLQKPCLTA